MLENDDESLMLNNQLCFAIYSAAHAIGRAYKPILEPLGLTYPQYLVLLVLWEQDGLMVKEIGRPLHLDSGTLTPMLKRLETMGYVRRTRDVSDERQVRVTLTERAREIQKHAAVGRRGLVCALGWSEQEIQALTQDLDQLSDTLRAGVADGADKVGPRVDAEALAVSEAVEKTRTRKRARQR